MSATSSILPYHFLAKARGIYINKVYKVMESSKLSELFNNHRFTAFLTVRLPRDLTTAQAKDSIRKRVVMPLQRRLKTQIAFIGVVVKHQPAVDVYAHAHISLFTKDGHTAEQMRVVLDLSQTTPSKPPSPYQNDIDLIQHTPAHAGYYDKATNYGDLIAYGTSLLKGRPSIDLSRPPLSPHNQSLEHTLMDYEDDYQAPERYERVLSTIARVPRSCEFCGAGIFVAPGPCSKCGTVGYRSGEPPAFRKMPRNRYDDPPELLPADPTWNDLEDVTVALY